jgi:hypothetical protein
MLCSIYFTLYRVSTLLTPFSPLEVATIPTNLIILMRNENSLVDIYVTDLYVYGWDNMYGWHMDEPLICMDDTCVYE